MLKYLALCAILLKLSKYSYFHNRSINIVTILVCLSVFPGTIGNKYVNSRFINPISMLLKTDLVIMM